MAEITAIKSGNWSDPTLWDLGHIPLPGDNVNIDFDVLMDYTYAANLGQVVLAEMVAAAKLTMVTGGFLKALNQTKLRVGVGILEGFNDLTCSTGGFTISISGGGSCSVINCQFSGTCNIANSDGGTITMDDQSSIDTITYSTAAGKPPVNILGNGFDTTNILPSVGTITDTGIGESEAVNISGIAISVALEVTVTNTVTLTNVYGGPFTITDGQEVIVTNSSPAEPPVNIWSGGQLGLGL